MLTKRHLLDLARCPKRFWLSLRRAAQEKDSADAPDWMAEQGRAAGLRAREEFPGGMLIAGPVVERAFLQRLTRAAMAGTVPHLFEAGFVAAGVAVRPDVLSRTRDGWVLTEVKASTASPSGGGLKPARLVEHDLELAIQLFVLETAGVAVHRCDLMLLNSEHRHPNENPLFVRVDRTEQARAARPRVLELIARAHALREREEPPWHDMGRHCGKGRDACPHVGRCSHEAGLDGPDTVLDLYRGSSRTWEAIASGIRRLQDLDEEGLSAVQLRQKQAHESGRPVIEHDGLAAGLAAWSFPLLYLDFETVSFSLPRHRGMAPWQQAPFQFSLHVELEPGAEPLHFEHLHDSDDDPRPALVVRLVDLLTRWPDAPIVAWYASFESDRLRELATFAPEHAAVLHDAADRLVDPLPLVRDTCYFAAFGGSFSLKDVAPALLGPAASYQGLEVTNGVAAICAWAAMIAMHDAEQRMRAREALLAYCKQDTRVMVDIVRHLRVLAAGEAAA